MGGSIFGQADDTLILSGDDSMIGVLQKWGNDTIAKLKKSLLANTSEGTSGALLQSLVVLPIAYADSKYLLTLQAEDYWKFINKGVQGVGGNRADGTAFVNKGAGSPFTFSTKKPPVNFSSTSGSSLRQWSHNKGLNEYAVRESIFRQGIKANHFFDEVIKNNWTADLVKKLSKAGAKEVEIIISKRFNGK